MTPIALVNLDPGFRALGHIGLQGAPTSAGAEGLTPEWILRLANHAGSLVNPSMKLDEAHSATDGCRRQPPRARMPH